MLAGATFDFGIAFAISYVTMNVGAMLNVLFVRVALKPCGKDVLLYIL